MPKFGPKIAIAVFILTIVFWVLLIYFFGSQQIVDAIGVKNGYLIMFLIALFGGVSSFTGATYITTIITLASGGLDPTLLALTSAAGVSVGDTFYFVLARRGSYMLKDEGKINQYVNKLRRWLRFKPKALIGLVIYVYSAFTPLPNDVLCVAMGLARQPYLLIIAALVLGNFTLTLTIAHFGTLFPF